jgi:DNA uptake protein ComE-like DNA-binding protein
MPQNKRQIKLTIILLLTIILISQFFLISLAKTEVYFSFFYNSISLALQKPEDKTINISSASPEELTRILQVSEPLARKIIALRDELVGFKEPQALTQLPEITNLEWEEWKEKGIIITIN